MSELICGTKDAIECGDFVTALCAACAAISAGFALGVWGMMVF